MDETTGTIIDKICLKYPEPTKLLSGHVATSYYSSLSLSTSDLARLAASATGHLAGDHFDVAVAASLTGVFFAVEAAGGKHVALLREDGTVFGGSVQGKRVALVDDVVCTGTTFTRARNRLEAQGARVVAYIVIVDRLSSPGELDGLSVWSAHQDELV